MTKEYLKVLTLRTIGNFLIFSSLAGVFLTFWPVVKVEAEFRWGQFSGKSFVLEGDKPPADLPKTSFGGLLAAPPPVVVAPLDRDFGIVIPKINANAKVVAEVDAGDYKEYMGALKRGVAHAKGTVYPGMIGNSFLFAHSAGNFWEVSRYNAVFYLLKELDRGDLVVLFWQGKRFDYEVTEKKTVDANEVGYLSSISNYPMLTLQTCWPPGTTLKRLLVFAKLKG